MTNESDSQNRNNLKGVNIAAALSASVISFFALIPVVNTISIPFKQNDAGVISLANAINVNPYTEYIRFLILLLVPLTVAVVTLKANQVLVSKYWARLSSIIEKAFSLLSIKKVFAILTLAMVFLWSVNRNYIPLNFTLNDVFHEGEYLGFLPNFLTLRKPFLSSFMIHGFGLDVLTSLIASNLATHSNIIALTRFLRMTEGLITYLGCFWIIWELVLSNKFKSISGLRIFLLSSVLFIILDGAFFKVRTDVFAGRDTLFILQLALTIRFFRIASTKGIQRIQKLALPIFIGATIPASVLYVYDRAAYFFFIYLLACILVVSFDRRISRQWLSGSIVGFTISAIALVVILGLDQATELLSQMSYWVRYGKYMTFMPPLPLSIHKDSIIFWRYFSFATLIHIFAIFYLIIGYRKSREPREFWRNNYSIIILLFASLMYMRITLDRSPDAGSGSLITAFLLIYLCLVTFKVYFESPANQTLLNPSLSQWTAGLLTVVILIHPVLNPLFLPDKLVRVYESYKTPDVRILRQDFLESYKTLKPKVDQSSCFFTLSSEGLWYYLFNKQSCTKFSILAYAKTTSAQETIVHEIDSRKPSIVLFHTGRDVIGRVPIVDSNPIVYQYFLNHYKPYALVAGHWFWQRDQQRLSFINHTHIDGSIDAIGIAKAGTTKINQKRISQDGLGNQVSRGDQAWLSGTSSLINQDKSTNAVYISYGEDNRLISVAWVAQDTTWRARIPTLSLPASSNGILRVWGYDAKDSQLAQVGRDIKIDLVSPAQTKQEYSF